MDIALWQSRNAPRYAAHVNADGFLVGTEGTGQPAGDPFLLLEKKPHLSGRLQGGYLWAQTVPTRHAHQPCELQVRKLGTDFHATSHPGVRSMGLHLLS